MLSVRECGNLAIKIENTPLLRAISVQKLLYNHFEDRLDPMVGLNLLRKIGHYDNDCYNNIPLPCLWLFNKIN